MEFAVFLTKARENQEAAQLCRSHGLYNACAARAYYAMFQAAVAILLAQGFIFEHRKHLDHAQIQSLFANELINRRKIFQSKFRSYLYDASFLRAIADYKAISISQAQANRQMQKLQEFIAAIQQEIPS
ncbi:HEPN domain-containing protein [bacterium]|nr:HEPN domain-containing protein [bacterium]